MPRYWDGDGIRNAIILSANRMLVKINSVMPNKQNGECNSNCTQLQYDIIQCSCI